MIYWTLLLLFFLSNSLVSSRKLLLPQSGADKGSRCNKRFCTLDNGETMFGELLSDHMDENTVKHIVKSGPVLSSDIEAKTGDIVVFGGENEVKLADAVLDPYVDIYQGTYVQKIIDPHVGKEAQIGHQLVDRPIPDLLKDMENDPLLAGLPEGLRSVVDPNFLLPTPTEDCNSDDTNQCWVIIPSATVFYSGPEPTNTACLSKITNAPPEPTEVVTSKNASLVFVVYRPPQVFDKCRKWLGGYQEPSFTFGFAQQDFSTLQYRPNEPPATKVMDFADMLCPPTDIAKAFDPTVPYSPIVLGDVLEVKYDFGAGMHGCHHAAVLDPPVHAVWTGEISDVDDDDGGWTRRKPRRGL